MADQEDATYKGSLPETAMGHPLMHLGFSQRGLRPPRELGAPAVGPSVCFPGVQPQTSRSPMILGHGNANGTTTGLEKEPQPLPLAFRSPESDVWPEGASVPSLRSRAIQSRISSQKTDSNLILMTSVSIMPN